MVTGILLTLLVVALIWSVLPVFICYSMAVARARAEPYGYCRQSFSARSPCYSWPSLHRRNEALRAGEEDSATKCLLLMMRGGLE